MRERKISLLAAILLLVVANVCGQSPAPASLEKLQSQFEKTFESGHYREAVPIAEERLKLCEATIGLEKKETLDAIHDLARAYNKTEAYATALPLCEREVQTAEKLLGKENATTARALVDLGNVFNGQQEFSKALALYQKALAIQEKTLGPAHVEVANTLRELAGIYEGTGDLPKAIELAKRAVAIYEKARGPDDVETATALAVLGDIYFSADDNAKALPIDERALRIRETKLGPDHPDTAESINDRGLMYFAAGHYLRAAQMFKRALAISEKMLGPDAFFTTSSLNNLGFVYRTIGEFSVAEDYYRRALESRERVLGPKDANLAISLNNLAGLLQDKGNYPEAEKLYRRALEVRETGLGPENPETARSLNDFAGLYLLMGDYAKAEPLFQRANRIFTKVLGPQNQETITTLNNLGLLYDESHQYAKAEALFLQVLKDYKKSATADTPDVAYTMSNLAVLHWEMGEYKKALPFAEQALKIREKALGPKHPKVSEALSNVAMIYRDSGHLDKAESLFQRALKIDQETLGEANAETGTILENLALLAIRRGKLDEASKLAVSRNVALEKQLADILSFTSERQRLAFQKTTRPYRLFGTLGDAADLAQAVLRQKGIVLDSLLEDRLIGEASTDPKTRELVERIRSGKTRLKQGIAGQGREREKVEAELEDLEARLARQVAGVGRSRRALGVTVKQVQSAIPKAAALIEFIRYDYYTGQPKDDVRYGAIVILPGDQPKWVALERGETLKAVIDVYNKSVRGQTDEATLTTTLRALHKKVWAPIEKILPAETKTVIISPDGQLNFVSFATLIGLGDKFLSEKYAVHYVASGRDLLRERKSSGVSDAVIYANPDFSGKTASESSRDASVASRSIELRDFDGLSLPPLPGTATEAAALQKRFGKSARVFLGANATKAELEKVDSPRILHLATHGFFLPEIEPGRKGEKSVGDVAKKRLVNPMRRSGLALAGAQKTLEAWAHGQAPPAGNDGIVTAEEVGGLKLDGTWLVVLSACDTGSGEARAGEGVMGLRRGFVQAGAQNLLMTLWPISDQTTVQIMLAFYDAAEKTNNAPQALADVQRDWLVKLRKEKGLLEAVRLAGPFIMSAQGKPR